MDPAECVNAFTMLVGIESVGDYFFLAIREALYICPRCFTGNVLIEGVTLSAIGWANNCSEPCQFSFVADKVKDVGSYNPVSFLHALSSANEVFPLPFLSFSFNIWILQGCDVLWLFYSSLIFVLLLQFMGVYMLYILIFLVFVLILYRFCPIFSCSEILLPIQ